MIRIGSAKRFILAGMPVLAFSCLTSFAPMKVAQAQGTAPVAAELTPEAVESRLKEKVSSRLELFLRPSDYRLFATAKVKNFREKVVLEGELESNSSGQEATAPGTAVLPGFQKIETREGAAKDVDRKERSKFMFRNRSELADIAVRLILDENLSQSVKDLAANTAKETITLTVGDVASFELVELDLTREEAAATNQSLWQWFTKYLSDRGGSAIDLLYLSLLLLGLLGAVFALRSYYKEKKKGQSGLVAAPDSANQAMDPRQIEEFCNQKLDEMIELLGSAPLITRNFLQNLKVADKATLYKALRTPALQSYFRKVLGLNQLSIDGPAQQDAKLVFERVVKDLQRYIRLNVEMESKAFGYLPQISGPQLANFIRQEVDKLKTLKVMGPYLSEHHVQEITRQLTVAEKATFIADMRDGDGALKQLATSLKLDDEKLQIDARLRERYAVLKSEAVVDASESEALEISFLESDRDCVSVIKSLAAKHGTLPSSYEKYLVGFEDLLGLDLGIARKVFQRVSNETLTCALANREMDDRLVSVIGDMRSQLVESLKQRGESVTEREIEDAQNEVMRLYRSMV